MNDKSRPSGKEDLFEVFRPQRERDVSSENYLPKKKALSQPVTGPLTKHQITDAATASEEMPIEPGTLTLSDTHTSDTTNDRADSQLTSADTTTPPTTLRVETFRIDLAERLAAMQAAQQKAKEQLSALEEKYPPADEPPVA